MRGLSPTSRVRLLVGAAALAAAGIVTGVVLATRQDAPQPTTQCSKAQPLFVPGVATQERSAVLAAFARTPARAAAHAMEPIAQRAPGDAAVQFNYAVALFCGGYLADADQAFRTAKKAGRDTFYEMRADQILHPKYFQPPDGLYPLFQPVANDPLLLRGLLLQRQGHQHSAARVYARAARLHPGDAEAQVAAAVARFDEDDLSASFSRLGPLVRRFPQSQSVRFHLGLLLAWTGKRTQAAIEFRKARGLDPGSTLGKQASAFLRGLVTGGTKGAQK
jgi:predicted Zn-dependent protease